VPGKRRRGNAKKVAAVNPPRRLAVLAFVVCLAAPRIAPAAWAESDLRAGDLDVILLLDKSLSMAPFFDEVKSHIATKIIEPILVPGDRIVVETVFGKVVRLLSMKIGSEEDKAKAIRALRSVRADGRYTDLGAALDAAKRDLDELGQSARPKYVLLISDERQEAPKGSPYASPDYTLRHPSLEYVKKLDLGKYRVITVGLQVGPKVEETAPAVMRLLLEAPARSRVAASETAGEAGGLAGPRGAAKSAGGGSSLAELALPSWLLFAALGLLAAALAGLAVILLVSRNKRREKEKTTV